MAFPTFSPNGRASFNDQPLKLVKLHEYGQHLLQYHDNIFGFHLCFCYLLLNTIMHHHIQYTKSIFTHKNVDNHLLITIVYLRKNERYA